jgi:hypothetical protein
MNFAHFNALIELIRPYSKHRKGQGKNSLIPFSLKVNSFIHFVVGGAICDIALSHGMGDTTTTTCIWEVMTAIHKCPHLNIGFPRGFAEQKQIAAGFNSKARQISTVVLDALMACWYGQSSHT